MGGEMVDAVAVPQSPGRRSFAFVRHSIVRKLPLRATPPSVVGARSSVGNW